MLDRTGSGFGVADHSKGKGEGSIIGNDRGSGTAFGHGDYHGMGWGYNQGPQSMFGSMGRTGYGTGYGGGNGKARHEWGFLYGR